MTEPETPETPACTRCTKPAALTCLACTKPICNDCAIPAPTSVTGYGDPTDTDLYFCSLRCEDINISLRKD